MDSLPSWPAVQEFGIIAFGLYFGFRGSRFVGRELMLPSGPIFVALVEGAMLTSMHCTPEYWPWSRRTKAMQLVSMAFVATCMYVVLDALNVW